MFRTLDIILIVIMTAAATVTYSIKSHSEKVHDEVRKLDSKIRHEQETIDLLKADWALATQPGRLAKLADAFHSDLGLQPTDPTQIIQPNELPRFKSEDGIEAAIGLGFKPAEGKTDNMKTGSVTR
jgi:hypothetical protein